IGLDQHAAAAAVPGLPPPQLGRDGIEIDREPRRNSFEDGDERFAVRLAGGQKTQHSRFILSEKIAASRTRSRDLLRDRCGRRSCTVARVLSTTEVAMQLRSEEHTSELQSRFDLVCRLL